MDAKAREAWQTGLDKGKVPELTAETVAATFRTMHDARGAMFERGVIECFKRLSWDYKTNNPFRFGKRFIMSHMFTAWRTGGLTTNHRACDELDDLIRVFSVLDGKPEPDHRNGMWRVLSDSNHERLMAAEHEYFSLKWFKKGSGHITFKRPDLVHQLNDIIAKHYPGALPAPRGES